MPTPRTAAVAMLADVVVDTDVLMHADNEASADRDASRSLIASLRAASTALCFDPGFHIDEARNRSGIAGEYFEHLAHGSLGLALVEECALSGRVRTVPIKVAPDVNRAIRQLIWDPTDRKFVKVAINSDERVLVTHNTSHIEPAAAELRRRWRVDVVDAHACCGRL